MGYWHIRCMRKLEGFTYLIPGIFENFLYSVELFREALSLERAIK